MVLLRTKQGVSTSLSSVIDHVPLNARYAALSRTCGELATKSNFAGPTKKYPTDLQELIEDKRYVTMRRHLRTLYPNPFTGARDWELVKASDGQIRGVRARWLSDGGGAKVFVFKPVDAVL